jgi:hypothetical protein
MVHLAVGVILAGRVVLTSRVVPVSGVFLRGIETSRDKGAGDPSIGVSVGNASLILPLETSMRFAPEVVR